MTDRAMVKAKAGTDAAETPNVAPLPPMPAPEDGDTPTTREDPIDSPQPNASAKRAAPGPGEHGLATKR